MTITESGIEKAEQELLKRTEVNLYDLRFFTIIKQILLTCEAGNICIFKAFTYNLDSRDDT